MAWRTDLIAGDYRGFMASTVASRRSGFRVMMASAAILVVLLVTALGIFSWTAVQGIRHPPVDQLPARSDAVVVFAGETGRFELGRDLVEAGVAPVLVLNMTGLPDDGANWCDDTNEDFTVICLTPLDRGTRGEARAFGALAAGNGWETIIGVTGDYHTQRSRLLLGRCFSGEIFMAQLEWAEVSSSVSQKELLAFSRAMMWDRSCWRSRSEIVWEARRDPVSSDPACSRCAR